MQRPRTSVLIVGHPVVAVPFCLVFGAVAIVGFLHDGFCWPVVIFLAMAGGVANLARDAGRYRAWKREWDAHDPDRKPPQSIGQIARNVVALLPTASIVWLAVTYRDPTSPAHVITPILLLSVLALWLLSLVLRLRKRRRSSSPDWVVTQAISRPLPAPTVADAYARLPEYLRPIFQPETARKE